MPLVLILALPLLGVTCARSSGQSVCSVFTHDLAHRPNHTVRDSPYFRNGDPEDDFKDLDSSLMQIPSEYELTLNFGSPPSSKVNVVVDTGSANLILQESGKPVSGVKANGRSFAVQFGSGSGTAQEYSDWVGLSCGEPIRFTFGVLSENVNLPNILGLAYERISQPASKPLPTFLGQLTRARDVANLFSTTLCGEKGKSRIIIGDNDHRVDLSQLSYAPVIEESYYVLPFKSMRIKGQTTSLGSFPDYPNEGPKTILDSGTTLNLVPRPVFEALKREMFKIKSGIAAAFFETIDPKRDEYAMPIASEVIAKFPTLEIEVASVKKGETFWLEIPPENYFKDVTTGDRVFGFRPSDGHPAFMFGQVLMESHYVVFDRDHKRVGFGSLKGLCDNN